MLYCMNKLFNILLIDIHKWLIVNLIIKMLKWCQQYYMYKQINMCQSLSETSLKVPVSKHNKNQQAESSEI